MHTESQGFVAEWLGSGLQNRIQRFDSARNLSVKPASVKAAGFLFTTRQEQVFRYQDQQEGKQAAEDDAKQGSEKLIQSEYFKEEKREVVNEHQGDGII